MDLRKASDTENHRILMYKFSAFNFSSDVFTWIEFYLLNQSYYVEVQAHQSAAPSLSADVPQGSVVGPLLFTLGINGLP